MKKIIVFFLISFLVLGCREKTVSMSEKINNEIFSHPTSSGGASFFYVDPLYGSMNNPGNKENPWSTLEEVINSKLIETKNIAGEIINKGAPVKAGDTIMLMTGYHGDINIKYAYNDKTIIIKSEINNTPIISSLTLNYGKNWGFDGIKVDGSLSSTLLSPKSYMIAIGVSGKYGDSENINIKNFHIYSEKNTINWGVDDWNEYAYNGIITGNHLHNTQITNNYIENVNLALNISSYGSVAIGNRIANFTKDGIRVSNSNIVLMHNIITDNLNVNANHDDGIQGYAGEVGLHDVLVFGNIIIENHDTSNKYPGSLQGIGFFDGPLSGIIVENNVIKIGGYHAISLYDSEKGRITNNIVTGIDDKKSRIALGTKNRGGLRENLIISNTAQVFLSDLDKKVIKIKNKVTELGAEEGYFEKLIDLSKKINTKYGSEHITSGKVRFSID